MPMGTPEQEHEKEMAAARLREAVELAGYGNPTETARRFGWPISTFLAHCNGGRGIDVANAKKYASRLKVHSQWLVMGIGEPRGRPGIDDQLISSGLPAETVADLTQQFGLSIESHKNRRR